MKKDHFLLKVLILGVGLAISFVLIAKVSFETAYDRCYTDSDRIYQIRTFYSYGGDTKGANFWNVSGAIAPGVMEYCPGVEAATRCTGIFSSDKYLLEDGTAITGKHILADTMFFDIFDRPILKGDPKKIFTEPCQMMVSRSFAEKIASVDEVVGRVICNETMTHVPLTIRGVFEDFPENASVQTDILLSMASMPSYSTTNWIGNDRYQGWVKLAKGVTPADLKAGVRHMQEKHQDIVDTVEKDGGRLEYSFVPIAMSHFTDTNARTTVLILSMIALVTLVISMLNYVLFSVSEIVRRSKEVAMRKCYGAEPRNIYAMLFRETAVVLSVAVVIAGMAVWSAQSLVDELIGVELDQLLDLKLYVILAVVVAVVFLVSALVPGLLYSKIPVNLIFSHLVGNKRRWKLSLLFLQFVISVALVVFMLIIGAQYRYALNIDMGYDYKNTLVIPRGGLSYDEMRRTLEPLRGLAEIEEAGMASELPISGHSGNNIFTEEEGELFNIADQYFMQPEFFKVFGIEIVEGHIPETAVECVVSEKFVEKIKEYSPWREKGVVGQTIRLTEHGEITVTGVYKEYVLGNIAAPDTRPSVISGFSEVQGLQALMQCVVVRLRELSPEALAAVNKTLDKFFPNREIEAKPYTGLLEDVYRDQRQMRNTIFIGSLFAVLVALLGLVGYIQDETQRRTKEMVIRKINGATPRELLLMFIADVLRIFAVAVVVSNIAVWFIADYWLELFVWKISLAWYLFVAGDVAVFAVVVVAVVGNTLKVVRANPVDSLTNE